jgi:hypothetical protein
VEDWRYSGSPTSRDLASIKDVFATIYLVYYVCDETTRKITKTPMQGRWMDVVAEFVLQPGRVALEVPDGVDDRRTWPCLVGGGMTPQEDRGLGGVQSVLCGESRATWRPGRDSWSLTTPTVSQSTARPVSSRASP